MQNIYIISGSYTKRYFEKDFIEELKKELNDNNILCFIPTDFADIEKNKERCVKMSGWFEQEGIVFNKKNIIDYSVNEKEAENMIKESNLIFLNGGDTLKQIEGINKLNIAKTIKNKGQNVVGMSAGAINLAKRVVVARDIEDNIPETKVYKGIGLSNINIEPHCDFEDNNHWNDLLEASKINKIYCMVDNCSIIIKDNKIKYFGNYCIIENGKIIFDNR